MVVRIHPELPKYFQMKKTKNEKTIKDIKHCLMVTDPTQEGKFRKVLHMVGHVHKPPRESSDLLRELFMMDEGYGLYEIADKVEISLAPDLLVKEFIKAAQKNPKNFME